MHHLHKPHADQNKAKRDANQNDADVSSDDWNDDKLGDVKIPPFTRQEVRALREKLGGITLELFLFKVLMWQSLSAVVIAILTWIVSDNGSAATSALYGAMCVVLPSALVVRTVMKKLRPDVLKHAGGRLTGLVVLELIKILTTICLLLAAPLLMDSPQWVAIVIGFAVTLKVYWVVALMSLRQPGHVKKIGINE